MKKPIAKSRMALGVPFTTMIPGFRRIPYIHTTTVGYLKGYISYKLYDVICEYVIYDSLVAPFLVFWSSLIHPLKCLQNRRKGPEKWGEDDPAFLTGALLGFF